MIKTPFLNLQQPVTVFAGDCLELLRQMPPESVQLVITSPPYNVGKTYEKVLPLPQYLESQQAVIEACVRVMAPGASLCWQVGNFIQKTADRSEVVPLDIVFYPLLKAAGLTLRNRVFWRTEHGKHARTRLSGRHETVLWFTKGEGYHFDVDAIRIPQKYPQKRAYRGPKKGQLSGHPLGKNPGDVWDVPEDNLSPASPMWTLPNVKANHVEKTIHEAQFPVELAERLILSLSRPGDLVLDPYLGAGSTACAAVMHGRRAVGAETQPHYVALSHERIQAARDGTLRTRPLGRPILAAPS